MHRVRLLLPYLRGCGIDATVLAVDAASVASPRDAWLADGIPLDIPIKRVRGLGLMWANIPGLGTLSNRAFFSLRATGCRLLRAASKTSPYDLIYFSTTEFSTFKLGPIWKREFGVPFVVDYQDPWVSDYYIEHPEVTPPGGRLKYSVSQWLARQSEPKTLLRCDGISSVSENYVNQIRNRYAFAKNIPAITLPFPADDRDLKRLAANEAVPQHMFNPNDGLQHWVYVGRGGQDMHHALRGLFVAFRNALSRDRSLATVRLHFLGTSYAAPGRGRPSIKPLAAEYGISHFVQELTDRIPYSTTLRCLLDASALIVPGSDDRGYTASKIYPYLLAGKPLLGIFHEQSSVHDIVQSVGGCRLVGFRKDTPIEQIAQNVYEVFFGERLYQRPLPLIRENLYPHTAEHQALKLRTFFEQLRMLSEKAHVKSNN